MPIPGFKQESSSPRRRVALSPRLFLLFALLLAALNLRVIEQSLHQPFTYYKDFAYDYISARAVRAGDNPYADAQTLTRRYLAESPVTTPDHPSSHTPLAITMLAPLAAVASYPRAAVVWCLFEILLIVGCARLLLPWRQALPAALLFFAWGPVKDELGNGQWTMLLLLLLLAAWRLWRAEREAGAGVALGAALAVKLSGGPILLFLLLQRRWRAVAAAVLTAAAGNLIAMLAMGGGALLAYYLKIGSYVTNYYRTAGHNYALWTVGFRMFEGSLRYTAFGFSAPPLIAAPALARPASVLCCLLVLGIGMAECLRMTRAGKRDEAFGLALYLTVLLNPVAWTYHMPLTVLPLGLTFLHLRRRGFPRRETILGILCFTIVSLPFASIVGLQQGFGVPDPATASGLRISFAVGMLSLLPAAGLIGLSALLARLSRLPDTDSAG